MAYASWSVVFGEQPSASKWNILGSNDASFNDGTGIANMSMSTTSVSNPYKFSVYRNSAATTGSLSDAKLTFDTELFDTNNNFASGTYTAPVAGFYFVNACVTLGSNAVYVFVHLYKNGVFYKKIAGDSTGSGNAAWSSTGSTLLQLAASDTLEIYTQSNGAATIAVGTGPISTYFEGHLVSRT